MKNSGYLIILLALGLVVVSYKWVSKPSSENTVNMENTAIENIMTRSSVRAYTDRDVTEEQVDTLLRAAMAAPTAGNKQPWRFVVIRDRETRSWISDNFQSMTMVAKAPLAIVVCGDVDATFPGEGREYWAQDASAATENLLLAAHAMGLGAVWCGIYPMSERVDSFSAKLGLPSNVLPLCCVAIGYPSTKPTPKDKWHPEYVHHDKW
jgi:hypothetical protein